MTLPSSRDSVNTFRPSRALNGVRYEIRGRLASLALDMERRGYEIVSLNIGNPGRFGFRAPETMRLAMIENLHDAEGYCHQKGIFPAREAVVMQQQARGVVGVTADEVFIGNGVSELIDLCLRGLLDPGDEVLVPSPDYPLWTASVTLNQGRVVHYPCAPADDFIPDPARIEQLVTPRTRAIVVINPNNPTGAVYGADILRAIAQVAERHRLVVFSDEIYDQMTYDEARFIPMATLVHDTLCATFSGLSKVYRACGFRVGWVSLSGDREHARPYIDALDLLASLRLCSNVTAQWAIKPALEGPNEIGALTAAGGRLHSARETVCAAVARSEFLRVVAPQGALYAFPSIDPQRLPEFDDARFALDLLESERILLVPGSSFNIAARNHFRVTLLPEPAVLEDAFARIERQLQRCAAEATRRVA